MAYKKTSVEAYIIEHISVPDHFNQYIQPFGDRLTKLADVNGSSSCCPFHSERTPSFRYWKPKKFFNCFGCGASGDVINLHRLWMEKKAGGERVSRKTAIADMCRLYGIQTKKPVDVGEKTGTTYVEEQSVFDKCRQTIHTSEALRANRKHFNLSVFQSRNAQIRNNPNLSVEQKFAAYDDLDLQAGIAISWSDAEVQAADELTLMDIPKAI